MREFAGVSECIQPSQRVVSLVNRHERVRFHKYAGKLALLRGSDFPVIAKNRTFLASTWAKNRILCL
jgi:hypothetical protein